VTRKRRNITDRDVDRWIGQGFGQGEGDHYRAWFKVRDVPSEGRSSRYGALRHKRTHQLLSDVESGHFLLADFQPGVVEIREQIALLPRDDTVRIANELGVKHPTYRGTRTPVVMTSDLWVDRNAVRMTPFVLCVKHESSLLPGAKALKRTIEKLAIERRYWRERGVSWRLVTQADLDHKVTTNLTLLRPRRSSWRSALACKHAQSIAEAVQGSSRRGWTFRETLVRCARLEEAFDAFGLAVWKHMIALDLRSELRWEAPIRLINGGRL